MNGVSRGAGTSAASSAWVIPLALAAGVELSASAQQGNPGGNYYPPTTQPGYQPGYGQPYNPGYGQPGYGQPGYGQPTNCPPGQWCPPGQNGYGTYTPPAKLKATGLERAYLYITAAAWGISTGAWIDVAAEIDDPGFAILPPLIFGAVAPGAIAITDYAVGGFPRGLPSAIATGTLLGAGLGLGIAGYEATNGNNWSANAILAANFVGSTTGAILGTVGGLLLKPSPKSNMLMMSSGFWGATIGAEFGGAASNGSLEQSDQDILLGGLIGYGLGVATTGTVSIWWVPSWNQLAWMWAGFGIGEVATTPIYLFYIGGDGEPRRGLIAQGIGGLLGASLFALVGDPDQPGAAYQQTSLVPRHFKLGAVDGGSLVPTPEVRTVASPMQPGVAPVEKVGFGLQAQLSGTLY